MMYFQGKAKYPVDEIVLHCAAIRTGQFRDMSGFQVFATLNRWHVEKNGWASIGYHMIIMPDGEVVGGRPRTMIGAHVRENNRGTFGVVMIEGKEVKYRGPGAPAPEFSDYFTEHQRLAVVDLVKYGQITRLSGHNDYAPKLCPGFQVRAEVFPELSPREIAFGKRPHAR
ncbi:MAG: N-acetylmuramoyl-L-alanine amidase [Paracoccaceae bacterium]